MRFLTKKQEMRLRCEIREEIQSEFWRNREVEDFRCATQRRLDNLNQRVSKLEKDREACTPVNEKSIW